MSDNLDTTHGNNIGDASLGTAAFVATVKPLQVALMTANGSETAFGTEVAGGSYARADVTFTPFASKTAASAVDVTFTNMPAEPAPGGVVGVELWDSAPARKWQGPLTTAETTNAGDTVSIAAGSLTVSLLSGTG